MNKKVIGISYLIITLLLTNCNVLSQSQAVETPTAASLPSPTTSDIIKVETPTAASPSTTTPDIAEVVVPVDSPVLPVPPAALAVSLDDPERAASTLADTLAGPNNLAAWLGLYQVLGIPVIGVDRKALDGSDDPIGPAYWQVWYAAGLDLPGHGIPLKDAGRLLGLAYGLKPEDSQTLGDTLLSDLRSALQSDHAALHLLGAVARERILRSGSKFDILESATTAETASIDGPMLQLIFWVALRGYLAHLPAQSVVTHGGTSLIAYHINSNTQEQKPFNCSEAWGDSDTTYWVNWLLNRGFGGGLGDRLVEGEMKDGLPSFLKVMQKYLEVGESMIKVTEHAIAAANIMSAAISFLMQLSAMDLASVQNPDKLERTKTTNDGKTATITWQLFSNPGKLPSGNERVQCLLSFTTNVLGVGFTFPSDGKIPGAELNFEAGMNIPDRVRFASSDYHRRWTNEHGEVQLEMMGKAQKDDLSETAKPIDMEYSVFVSAQPEEMGLNSMANVFFGGFTFGLAPKPISFLSSLIDILKGFTYDMGEHTFPMTDWGSQAYVTGLYERRSVICNLEQPFIIKEDFMGGISSINYIPSSAQGGTVSSFDITIVSIEGDTWRYWSAGGSYIIKGTETKGAAVPLELIWLFDVSCSINGHGPSCDPPGPGQLATDPNVKITYYLQPLDTDYFRQPGECGLP